MSTDRMRAVSVSIKMKFWGKAGKRTDDHEWSVQAKDEDALVGDAVLERIPVGDVPQADKGGQGDLDAVGHAGELKEGRGALLVVAALAADPEVHGDLNGDLEVGEEEVPRRQGIVGGLEKGVIEGGDVVLAQVPEDAEPAALSPEMLGVEREEVDD